MMNVHRPCVCIHGTVFLGDTGCFAQTLPHTLLTESNASHSFFEIVHKGTMPNIKTNRTFTIDSFHCLFISQMCFHIRLENLRINLKICEKI